MQNTIEVPVSTQIQSLSRESTRSSVISRLNYIDMVRFVLMIMVIMVHAAVTYGAEGDWTYTDYGANDMLTIVILSLFVIMSQAFFMGLFFFFAGYFTPGAFDRKGVVKFWIDRIVHIAIPMTVYTWFLSRIPNYLDAIANRGETQSFWQFSSRTMFSQADGGPTWFLFALLAFSLGYTLVRLAAKVMAVNSDSRLNHLPAPKTSTLLWVSAVLAVIMFIIAQSRSIDQPVKGFNIFTLMVAFFPFYIVLFVGGILAYRNDWLSKMPSTMLRFWGWLSLGLIIFLPIFLLGTGAVDLGLDLYLRGFNWRCALISAWLGLSGIAFSTTMTLWMRDHIKPGNRVAKAVGPNTFGIYLIHPVVLVPITFLMTGSAIHPMIKFAIASVSTIVICFVITEILRRIPIVKKIM